MRKPKRKRKKQYPVLSVEQQSQLVQLIEEWTRYEVAARLLPLHTNVCGDYYRRMLEKENEIRILLYGESGLNELAVILGIGAAEDKFYIRPERTGTPFAPDKKRLRNRAKRKRELRPDKGGSGRVGTEVEEISSDIEAILIAAGVE